MYRTKEFKSKMDDRGRYLQIPKSRMQETGSWEKDYYRVKVNLVIRRKCNIGASMTSIESVYHKALVCSFLTGRRKIKESLQG